MTYSHLALPSRNRSETVDMKFKVIICGGGIAGLTLAVALAKYPNIAVEIYEAASEFSAIGAGIGVWPRAWDILNRLGLGAELTQKTRVRATTDRVHAFTFRKSDEAEGKEFYKLFTSGAYLTFHRHDIQATLVSHLPPSCCIHFSKRLYSYSRSGGGKTIVEFEDGATASCDLLVGADGLKSVVRRALLEHLADSAQAKSQTMEAQALRALAPPVWAGTVAYRALVPLKNVQKELYEGELKIPEMPTQFLGKNRNMIIYRLNENMVNVIAVFAQPQLAFTEYRGPWCAPVSKEELLGIFEHWEPLARNWLHYIEKPTSWAVHVVQPLPSYVGDGVTIMGDAAHAMVPHQASGAGQAIEDAFFLATLLGHPLTTLKTLQRALSIYDEFRRPFSADIARRSLLNGQYYTFNHDLFDYEQVAPEHRDGKLAELGDAITQNWQWAWTTTLNNSLQEAIQRLEHTV